MQLAKNFEKYFMVSEQGEVFSLRTNRLLKVFKNSGGYLQFSTRFGGRKSKAVRFLVHRLVAETFIPNPENKSFVNHIDCNKTNNCVSNLEWVTAKENFDHAYTNGLICLDNRGSLHALSKLTEDEVIYILKSYKPYSVEFSQSVLAKQFNVGRSCIQRIVSRAGWTHLTAGNH